MSDTITFAQIRVWTTANPTTNDTPLIVTGQTVTNGIDGASFGWI